MAAEMAMAQTETPLSLTLRHHMQTGQTMRLSHAQRREDQTRELSLPIALSRPATWAHSLYAGHVDVVGVIADVADVLPDDDIDWVEDEDEDDVVVAVFAVDDHNGVVDVDDDQGAVDVVDVVAVGDDNDIVVVLVVVDRDTVADAHCVGDVVVAVVGTKAIVAAKHVDVVDIADDAAGTGDLVDNGANVAASAVAGEIAASVKMVAEEVEAQDAVDERQHTRREGDPTAPGCPEPRMACRSANRRLVPA